MMNSMISLVVLALVATPALATCPLVFEQNFNQYGTGIKSYTQALVESDFPSTKGPYKMLGVPDGTCKIKDATVQGFFPKGKILGYSSGFTFKSTLPKPVDEATMEYDVYFSKDFDWTLGGKLPGFCGYDCPVGCTSVGKDRGFSARLMWRSRGRLVAYNYYPDKPQAIKCGEDWMWQDRGSWATLKTGQWHRLRIYMKVNTFSGGTANQDGIFMAWLDGQPALNKRNIRWRYNEKFQISDAYLTTYVGGSDPRTFAPKQDQFIWFDNFKFWSNLCPPGMEGSSTPVGLIKSPAPAPAPVTPTQAPPATPATPTKAPPAAPSAPSAPNLAKKIGSYTMFAGVPGWTLPSGDLKSVKPGGSVSQRPARCAAACDNTKGCVAFTVSANTCVLKRNSGKTAAYIQAASTATWTWLYSKTGTTIKQPASGPGLSGQSPSPSPTATPAPAPAVKSQSVALKVSFISQNAFSSPNGMCGTLKITNPSGLTCKSWDVTVSPDTTHISTKGSKSANMKPDAKQFVFHNSPNEAAHIIGPGKTITSKVPSFCVYYTSTKRSFSKNQVAGFLPWTGVCQT